MKEIKSTPANAFPIALAFTTSYVVPAATTIISVLRSAETHDVFHFICLLTEDLSEEIRKNLQELGGSRAYFTFINMAGRLENIYIDEKYTIAASYRLLLPDLVPECDKILYIDCDIIIRNNIAKLFRELKLDDYYMAGVFEAALPGQLQHLSEIGCQPGKYMNSGFLLMNLQRLREDNMVPQFLEASKDDTLEFPDQDVINMLCKGQLLGLPPYWNSIRTFMLPQYQEVFLDYYTQQDWEDVQTIGNVHYTGPKPWKSFSISFDIWWQHYAILPISIKKRMKFDLKIKLLATIYNLAAGKFLVDTTRDVYRKIKK